MISKRIFVVYFIKIFFIFFVFSCNNKTKSQKKNNFIITIDLIAYSNISIQVFYKLHSDDSYCEKLSVKKKMSKSTILKRIQFKLPHDIKPKNIRIDFGENENEGDSLDVENIRFQYKNKFIYGNKNVYKTWFIFNPNIIEGKDHITYHLKKINSIFDPQINGNRKLNMLLVKLFPPDINEIRNND